MRQVISFADGDRNAIAFDQPPSFIGDGVGRDAWFQTAMSQAGELLQLRPDGLAIGEQPELAGFEIVFRQGAHLQHEPQITAFDRGRAPAR